MSICLDKLGFIFQMIGSVGIFMTLAFLSKSTEITDAFEKHIHISTSLRTGLDSGNKKKFALLLLSDGLQFFAIVGLVGFIMQIPLKFFTP